MATASEVSLLPPLQPQSRSVGRHVLSVAWRVLLAPALFLVLLIALAVITDCLRYWELINGEFFIVAVIGCLGGLGGSVAAAREGKIAFPLFDPEGKLLKLGAIQECMFGAVGAFAIFLVTPGISEQALNMGRDAFQAANIAAKERAKEEKVAKEKAAKEKLQVDPTIQPMAALYGNLTSFLAWAQPEPAAIVPKTASKDGPGADKGNPVDWIEMIAIALIGGYAGRAIITRALAGFVSKEEIEQVETHSREMFKNVQSELRQLVQQRDRDHQAIKLFQDQIDIYTRAPREGELKDAIKSAAPTIHDQIYVEARRVYHTILNMAEMSKDLEKAKQTAIDIATRVLPIMETLCEVDATKKFRGCRYMLAVACDQLGKSEDALKNLQEAIAISNERYGSTPREYRELLAKIEAALQPA